MGNDERSVVEALQLLLLESDLCQLCDRAIQPLN